MEFGIDYGQLKVNRRRNCKQLVLTACSSSDSSISPEPSGDKSKAQNPPNALDFGKPLLKLQQAVAAIPPAVLVVSFLLIAVRLWF